MFGCCVAGRVLQTNIQQIDDTHACFELPAAETINHICVFLLGTVPFPDGYGASVHLFWPGKGFQLLGMLSNEKPSAIFRLRGNFSSAFSGAHAVFSGASTPVADVSPQGVTALLGLSIEPLQQILDQVASLPSNALQPRRDPAADAAVLAERIVKHLFNYLSGFAGGGVLTPESAIPMGTILRWYESFTSKIRNSGIGFLENQQS